MHVTMFYTYQTFMYDVDGKNRGLFQQIAYPTNMLLVKTRKTP